MDSEHTLTTIITLAVAFLSAFVAVVTFIVKFVKALKAYKAAKTKSERQAALLELKTAAKDLVAELEQKYMSFEAALEQAGIKTGTIKFDSALASLQRKCIELKQSFSDDELSQLIENEVSLLNTRKEKPTQQQ